MTNQVTKLQSAILNENTKNFNITLVRNDGAEVLLEFSPEILAELAGLAGMASQLLSEDGRPVMPVEDAIRIMGVGASPTADNTAINLRLEDKDGFLHDFEADEGKCTSLRFQLRRAIEALRKAKAENAKDGAPNIKLAINNPKKNSRQFDAGDAS